MCSRKRNTIPASNIQKPEGLLSHQQSRLSKCQCPPPCHPWHPPPSWKYLGCRPGRSVDQEWILPQYQWIQPILQILVSKMDLGMKLKAVDISRRYTPTTILALLWNLGVNLQPCGLRLYLMVQDLLNIWHMVMVCCNCLQLHCLLSV